MNQTISDMITRRSVRAFRSEPISQKVLEQILEAGTYAPTGMRR